MTVRASSMLGATARNAPSEALLLGRLPDVSAIGRECTGRDGPTCRLGWARDAVNASRPVPGGVQPGATRNPQRRRRKPALVSSGPILFYRWGNRPSGGGP